jgi:hypothetical protein
MGSDFTGTRPVTICKYLNTNSLLEARVGIGRFTSVSARKIYAISPINASVFALLLHYQDEPLPTHLLKLSLKVNVAIFNN